jgi:hypothetical protein
MLLASTGLFCMDPYGLTPLEMAAQPGRQVEFEALLKNYARIMINPTTGQASDAVREAVNRFGTNSRSALAGYFNGPMLDCSVRLITGILLGNVQQVQEAISGARINSQTANQGYAAAAASRIMSVTTMQTPMQRFLNGATGGIRPLFAAVAQGNRYIVALLIYEGASFAHTEVDAAGRTIDHVAHTTSNHAILQTIQQARQFAPNSTELRNFASAIALQGGYDVAYVANPQVVPQNYHPGVAGYPVFDPTVYAQHGYADPAAMYHNIDPAYYQGASPYGAGYNPHYSDPSFQQ